MTFGALTIRIAADTAESIWLTMGEAIQRLNVHPHGAPPPGASRPPAGGRMSS